MTRQNTTSEPGSSSEDSEPLGANALSRAGYAMVVSILVLLPCFWQTRIQAIDLSSHVYNAWLSSLVSQNRAQGLWMAHQFNNVLFDWVLGWLLPRFGSSVAQRLAVSATVLIFFWGVVIFVSRGWPRNWQFVLPSVLTLSYGTIFRTGFFNFYLSLGVCLWFLTIFLSGSQRFRLLPVVLLPIAWTAHPLPVVWAVGLAAYEIVAHRLPPRRQPLLLLSGVASILISSAVLGTKYPCYRAPAQILYATGANQLLISPFYVVPFFLLLLAWAFLFLRFAKLEGWEVLRSHRYLQFWILTVSAVALVPTDIFFPGYSRPLEFVTLRLSLFAGVTLCAVLARVQSTKLEKMMLLLGAITFFSLFYWDTRKLNQAEDHIDAVVAQLPSNARVIGHFTRDEQGLPTLLHAVDRACIGHCFSYANYEASSRQFRVRANPGNGIVMTEAADIVQVERGKYQVKSRDLPVFLVYSCGPAHRDICSRELHPGDDIGLVSREP